MGGVGPAKYWYGCDAKYWNTSNSVLVSFNTMYPCGSGAVRLHVAEEASEAHAVHRRAISTGTWKVIAYSSTAIHQLNSRIIHFPALSCPSLPGKRRINNSHFWILSFDYCSSLVSVRDKAGPCNIKSNNMFSFPWSHFNILSRKLILILSCRLK